MRGGMGGGGMRFGGMGGGAHFAAIGPGPGFSRPGFVGGPRFGRGVWGARYAQFHHPFFRNRFRRFAFVGFPYYYADYGYDACWSRVWTAYGLQWVNVCGDYGSY
jgi:hypothetical protein